MSSRARRRYPSRNTYSLYAVVLGLLVFGGLVLFTSVSRYMAWLTAWSLVAFGFYGYDKIQAQRSGWRVPEIVLHGLALIGGFPGALLGMVGFRHKTLHGVFWIVIIASACLHALIRYFLVP